MEFSYPLDTTPRVRYDPKLENPPISWLRYYSANRLVRYSEALESIYALTTVEEVMFSIFSCKD
jgi:hypothetical protein